MRWGVCALPLCALWCLACFALPIPFPFPFPVPFMGLLFPPARPMPWGELSASAALLAIMEALLLALALSGSAMAALASTGCARGPMHSDVLDPSLVSSAQQPHVLSRWCKLSLQSSHVSKDLACNVVSSQGERCGAEWYQQARAPCLGSLQVCETGTATPWSGQYRNTYISNEVFQACGLT